MAAPAFRSKNALNYASRNSPMTVTKPAGTTTDDIIVATAALGHPVTDTGVDISPPDGTWTAIRASTAVVDSGSFEVKLYGWWKRAGSSEPASYDFTQNAGNVRNTEVVLAAYSGCITSGSPIDAVSANSGSGTNATATSITTTVNDTLLVVFDNNWTGGGTHVAPSGFTERHEALTTINDAAQTTAGASGNKGPYAVGNGGGTDQWQSWLFALKPAGGAANVSVNVTGNSMTASSGTVIPQAPITYSSRDWAFGSGIGGGYAIYNLAAYDIMLAGSYIASALTGTSVSVSVTGVSAAVNAGTASVTVTTGVSVSVTGNSIAVSGGNETVAVGTGVQVPVGGSTAGLLAPPSGAGVLPGVTRTTYSGSMTITSNNTTISNKNINVTAGGTLHVHAANVTLSNCMILCNDFYGIEGDDPATSGMVVDHCTIIGLGGETAQAGILTGTNWTITNCDISGFTNGVLFQQGTGLAEGNYIHNLGFNDWANSTAYAVEMGARDTAAGTYWQCAVANTSPGSGTFAAYRTAHPTHWTSADPHTDGMQTSGPSGPGVMIRNNWIESFDTSAIFLKTEPGAGPISGVTITGNTLAVQSGRDYSQAVYVYASNYPVTGTVITNNRMQAGFTGGYVDYLAATATESGNVDYVTGNHILGGSSPGNSLGMLASAGTVTVSTTSTTSVSVPAVGVSAAVSAGAVVADVTASVVVTGFSLAASIGEAIVLAFDAWSPATLTGSGVLSYDNLVVTTPVPGAATIESAQKHSTGLHYVETTIVGPSPTGSWGIYDPATDSGSMIDLATGSLVLRPLGSMTPLFAPIKDGDVLKAAYDGAGTVWYRVNDGAWNNDLAQAPDSTGIGLWEIPTDVGCSGTLTPWTPGAAGGILNSDGTTVIFQDADAVIENFDIPYAVSIRNNNITLRNCLLHGVEYFGVDVFSAFTNCTIDHCTVTGIGSQGALNMCNGFVVKNCDISGYENGIFPGSDGLITNNYIHDLTSFHEDPHLDGIQFSAGSNVEISDNWIESWDTSCIIIKADGGPIDNILVENNTLVVKAGEGIASPIYTVSVGLNLVTNIRINRNRMQHGFSGLYLNYSQDVIPECFYNIDYFTSQPVLLFFQGYAFPPLPPLSTEYGLVHVHPVEPRGVSTSVRGDYVGLGGDVVVATPTRRSHTLSPYVYVDNAYVDAPPGVQENDLVLMYMFRGKTNEPMSPPVLFPSAAGFKQLGDTQEFQDIVTKLNVQVTTWWKRAGPAEPPQYLFAFFEETNTQCFCAAYPNVTLAGAIDAFRKNQGLSSTATGTGFETSQETDLLIYLGTTFTGDGARTPPTGMTEVADSVLYVAEQTLTAHGATGDRTLTLASSEHWSSVLLALRGV